MSLNKSRRIITFLLSLVMAIGVILFTCSQTVYYTICNENYMTKVFSSDKLNTQCEESFLDKIEAVSAQSNIPTRVFEAILDENAPPSKTAVQRMFDGNDATLYSDDLVAQFQDLCVEYLDGNEISYNSEMVHRTAESAAKAYSESFGINDIAVGMSFVSSTLKIYGKFSSIGLLLFVASFTAFLFLFSDKKRTYRALYSAFTATGGALFLIGIIGIIISASSHPAVNPQIYADALVRAVCGTFTVIFAVGLLITAAAVYGSVTQYINSKKKA
jgi:uncharacterized membrane protein YgdD (TMEM256/DUF423 family)